MQRDAKQPDAAKLFAVVVMCDHEVSGSIHTDIIS